MRIIGGKWRGRALAELGDGDEAAHLRPSSDRMRESLFNILRHEPYNAPKDMRVLDLFAGSGALSFEALSRGASHATLVDNGIKARALIRENTQKLFAIQDAELLRRDALDLGECKAEGYDLVFLDPPYGQKLGERAILSAYDGGWLSSDALVVWEEEAPPQIPPFLTLLDQRKIGRAVLSISRLRG